MKNLKTLLGFGILMGALMVNTTFAGIMISDSAQIGGCVAADTTDDQSNSSVIGVLIGEFAGVLFGDTAQECGPGDVASTGIMISD